MLPPKGKGKRLIICHARREKGWTKLLHLNLCQSRLEVITKKWTIKLSTSESPAEPKQTAPTRSGSQGLEGQHHPSQRIGKTLIGRKVTSRRHSLRYLNSNLRRLKFSLGFQFDWDYEKEKKIYKYPIYILLSWTCILCDMYVNVKYIIPLKHKVSHWGNRLIYHCNLGFLLYHGNLIIVLNIYLSGTLYLI